MKYISTLKILQGDQDIVVAGCMADGADAAGKACTVTAEYTMLVDAIYSVTMGIIMTQNRFLPFPKTQLNKIAVNPMEDVH